MDQGSWTRITDALVEKLREEIRSGVIPPGCRLRQVEVAARFNVSTTPIREAFAVLEQEGLLVGYPHRGVIVFEPSIAELQELYEIRIPLEFLATELAVPNLEPPVIEEIGALLASMDHAVAHASFDAMNERFHSLIYTASGRPRLAKLIGDLRRQSSAYRHLLDNSVSNSCAQEEHWVIYEACKARAPKRAAKAMAAHLGMTVERVTALITEAEGTTDDTPGADRGLVTA